MIDAFKDGFEFLSNFYHCPITYGGLTYRSAEAAYQAQKTVDIDLRRTFCTMSSLHAKRAGKKLHIRANWDSIKLRIMTEIVAAKFDQHWALRALLVGTAPHELIEGNWWGDKFWGVCKGVGENHLGLILMAQREKYVTSSRSPHDS